jgi:hypothetical protein
MLWDQYRAWQRWGLPPADFWTATPADWWAVFDVRRTDAKHQQAARDPEIRAALGLGEA